MTQTTTPLLQEPPRPRACFVCGDPNHLANVFPQKGNRANNNNNATNQGARARVFNVNTNQAQNNNDVVNGTFLINGLYASMLFDTGADKSFVSLEFEPLLATPRTKLNEPYDVEVANGKTVHLSSLIPNCTLNLNEHNFSIDLVPMKLGSFDIIVGMDWLTKKHAEIVCFEKYIHIPLGEGQELKVYGEKVSKGLKLMSCTKTQKYYTKST